MREITLFCSAHRDHGLCNVAEMLKILRAIAPETVFEEVRPKDFASYCQHAPLLEAQAVKRYQVLTSARRVPIDRYEISDSLIFGMKRALDAVFDYVELTSREYQLIAEENDATLCEQGFSYLNSEAFATIRTRLSEIEDTIVRQSENEGLIQVLKGWRQLTEMREREMVNVIYSYCRENHFETGVLVVGAAHKAGIVKEIKRQGATERGVVSWKLSL